MHLNFGAMHTASISGVSMNSCGGSIYLCYFHFANMYFLDCFFFIILVWCVLLHFGTQLVTISSSKMLQSFQLKYNMLKHPAAPTGHYFSIFSFWTWASNGGITSILHCLVTLTPLRSNFGLPPSPTQYPVHRPIHGTASASRFCPATLAMQSWL
jgi:hypothetical protein